MAAATSERSVLVVEDNQDIAVALRDLLVHDGYTVSVVDTCMSALEHVRTHHFNAILLDLSLPDGDGIEVLRTVQHLDPTLPVVIVTANASTEATVGLLTRGAFHYLTKPYNTEELRHTLRRAVGVKELAVKVEQVEHLLSESEDRFRSLVEAATDAIIVADARGLIVSWNRAASTLFGYSNDEAIGQPLTILMPERYRPAHERGLARMASTGSGRMMGSVVQLHGLKKNGMEFPIELSLASWRNASNTFYSGIIRDISERTRVEGALRASEERLELVIRGSSDGFWDARVPSNEPWNVPHTPVWWSPRVKSMLGYTDEEFPDVLDSWTTRIHPEDTDRVLAALTAHLERRDPYDVEYRLLTKAGEYRWFRARGQAIWDDRGRVTRMSGSLQCVTDRKRAEDALRRNEKLLQDVINNTTAVIYVKYTDGRYLLTNRRFEQLFHLTSQQIVGHTDHEIFPKDFADAFRANDVLVRERNTTVEYEEYAPHEDGPHAYISIKFPLCDHTGTPYAVCGISTDITARKRMEEALRANDERVRLALSSSHVGIWEWDLQTGRFEWSPQVDEFLGVEIGSVQGSQNDLLSLVHPNDRETIVLAMRHALDQQGTDVMFEHRVQWPDGTLHRLAWAGHIFRDYAGNAVRILGTVHEQGPHRG